MIDAKPYAPVVAEAATVVAFSETAHVDRHGRLDQVVDRVAAWGVRIGEGARPTYCASVARQLAIEGLGPDGWLHAEGDRRRRRRCVGRRRQGQGSPPSSPFRTGPAGSGPTGSAVDAVVVRMVRTRNPGEVHRRRGPRAHIRLGKPSQRSDPAERLGGAAAKAQDGPSSPERRAPRRKLLELPPPAAPNRGTDRGARREADD